MHHLSQQLLKLQHTLNNTQFKKNTAVLPVSNSLNVSSTVAQVTVLQPITCTFVVYFLHLLNIEEEKDFINVSAEKNN